MFIRVDTNSNTSKIIDAAIATGNWIDVGAVYAPESGPELTYGGEKNWYKVSPGNKVTRPDRVLANRIGAQMIISYEVVRNNTVPNHLPIKLRLSTKVLLQLQTVMALPKRYPMEMQMPMEKEQRERNLPEVYSRQGEKTSTEQGERGCQTKPGDWRRKQQKFSWRGCALTWKKR